MKKIIISIAIISFLFVGCEKERCFTCVSKATAYGTTVNETTVICGTMTKAEAKKQAGSGSYSGSGIKVTVDCTAQ